MTRISYDSYGCCKPDFPAHLGRMSTEDTELLLGAVEGGDVGTPAVAEVLRAYFSENRDSLWADALVEHELVPS
ncbi:MAG: hypothetical protein KC731_28380 [Myxococcales bacterium]|nr:hypothetical protein [Myxococcales bacterium]